MLDNTQVSTFNDRELKSALAASPVLVREYVVALKDALRRQQEVTTLAIKKLRELAGEHK